MSPTKGLHKVCQKTKKKHEGKNAAANLSRKARLCIQQSKNGQVASETPRVQCRFSSRAAILFIEAVCACDPPTHDCRRVAPGALIVQIGVDNKAGDEDMQPGR